MVKRSRRTTAKKSTRTSARKKAPKRKTSRTTKTRSRVSKRVSKPAISKSSQRSIQRTKPSRTTSRTTKARKEKSSQEIQRFKTLKKHRTTVRYVDKTNYLLLLLVAIIGVALILIVIKQIPDKVAPADPLIMLNEEPSTRETVVLDAESRFQAENRATDLTGKAYICNAVTLDGQWTCSPVKPTCQKVCKKEMKRDCSERTIIAESELIKGSTDRDGGLGFVNSIGIRTIATDGKETRQDTCVVDGQPALESTVLREYFLNENGLVVSTDYNCLAFGYSRCEEGACVDCETDELTVCVYECN